VIEWYKQLGLDNMARVNHQKVANYVRYSNWAQHLAYELKRWPEEGNEAAMKRASKHAAMLWDRLTPEERAAALPQLNIK
jgi:hypothetical protein